MSRWTREREKKRGHESMRAKEACEMRVIAMPRSMLRLTPPSRCQVCRWRQRQRIQRVCGEVEIPKPESMPKCPERGS